MQPIESAAGGGLSAVRALTGSPRGSRGTRSPTASAAPAKTSPVKATTEEKSESTTSSSTAVASTGSKLLVPSGGDEASLSFVVHQLRGLFFMV